MTGGLPVRCPVLSLHVASLTKEEGVAKLALVGSRDRSIAPAAVVIVLQFDGRVKKHLHLVVGFVRPAVRSGKRTFRKKAVLAKTKSLAFGALKTSTYDRKLVAIRASEFSFTYFF
jgi:hypothetical protein